MRYLQSISRFDFSDGNSYLKLDASVATSGDLGGFLLVQVDQFAAWRLGDAAFVAQSRVRHPTTETQPLNHFCCFYA